MESWNRFTDWIDYRFVESISETLARLFKWTIDMQINYNWLMIDDAVQCLGYLSMDGVDENGRFSSFLFQLWVCYGDLNAHCVFPLFRVNLNWCYGVWKLMESPTFRLWPPWIWPDWTPSCIGLWRRGFKVDQEPAISVLVPLVSACLNTPFHRTFRIRFHGWSGVRDFGYGLPRFSLFRHPLFTALIDQGFKVNQEPVISVLSSLDSAWFDSPF